MTILEPRPVQSAMWANLRSPDEVLRPEDLGGARSTRHSFARSMLRRAAARGWRVTRCRFDLDAEGCGVAVYQVEAEGYLWSFVAFSQNVGDSGRTDRVIAESWDMTAALVEGEVSPERAALLQEQVPLQEAGRAEEGTLVWTRANRSERFFDYVVDRLAEGRQPDPDAFGCSPYLMRSTAFYSNGKFGLVDYESFHDEHPLAVPYRAHMLAAWLLRELSYDVAEHCARVKNPQTATNLTGDWRRYLGLGNATGLGMVPYVINHPRILDAWIRLRELPLAAMLQREVTASDPEVERVRELLARAIRYLEEQHETRPAPYLAGPELAGQLRPLVEQIEAFRNSGESAERPRQRLWHTLHETARKIGPECRGVVASVLTELTDEFDEIIDLGLRCDERPRWNPRMRCGELLAELEGRYRWVKEFDFDRDEEAANFWFSSANSEEPRRARRSIDPGEDVQHGVGIAKMVSSLWADLQAAHPDTTIAEFLLEHPSHRGTVTRVQSNADLDYAEVRANLLSSTFLPLHLQRLQLAVYGMENFNPQSTDWLRVTLLSGAPRIADLAAGCADDDWMFTPRPSGKAPR
jgi:hypothetical protein